MDKKWNNLLTSNLPEKTTDFSGNDITICLHSLLKFWNEETIVVQYV